jgi:ubiquinone/menaquinone biosynthesis C-methylase UbiE
MKRKIYYLLSPNLRLLARRVYYYPQDLFAKLTKKSTDDLIPPKGLIFVGPGDFKKQGENLLNLLKTTTGLKPNHKVLDVGCGIGRLAVPLTNYLDKDGSYEGFDIVDVGINWCKKHISSKFPNFNFFHVDLKNDLYNLKTQTEANTFTFPYADDCFDVVVLTSVFTHMMPDDVDNYLNQIQRVLKPGGKCFATFFLLNEESQSLIDNKKSAYDFAHKYEHYSLLDKNVKEANIAFEEDYLKNDLIAKNNLKTDRVAYGWWAGRSKNECLDFQDIIILQK